MCVVFSAMSRTPGGDVQLWKLWGGKQKHGACDSGQEKAVARLARVQHFRALHILGSFPGNNAVDV